MSKKHCPSCGASNSPLAVHCSACGTRLSGGSSQVSDTRVASPSQQEQPDTSSTRNLVECPDCGKQVSPRAVSCPNCGLPMESSQSPPASTDLKAGTNKQNLDSTGSQPTPGQRIIAAILAVVLFTHGYFLIRYKALTPCEAAARKMVLDMASEQVAEGNASTTGGAVGTLIGAKYIGLPVARLRMSVESTAGCYAIALGLKSYKD